MYAGPVNYKHRLRYVLGIHDTTALWGKREQNTAMRQLPCCSGGWVQGGRHWGDLGSLGEYYRRARVLGFTRLPTPLELPPLANLKVSVAARMFIFLLRSSVFVLQQPRNNKFKLVHKGQIRKPKNVRSSLVRLIRDLFLEDIIGQPSWSLRLCSPTGAALGSSIQLRFT